MLLVESQHSIFSERGAVPVSLMWKQAQRGQAVGRPVTLVKVKLNLEPVSLNECFSFNPQKHVLITVLQMKK